MKTLFSTYYLVLFLVASNQHENKRTAFISPRLGGGACAIGDATPNKNVGRGVWCSTAAAGVNGLRVFEVACSGVSALS